MKNLLPELTVVVGGAASGKSRLAESLAETHGTTKVYLATAQIRDAEMAEKVELHKKRRVSGWHTVEAPLNAAQVLQTLTGDVCLFDCATLWLTNQMLMPDVDLAAAQEELLTSLKNCAIPVILVTNEVGEGIVPENALARRFREAQGRLNIDLAAQADLVIKVTVGLPQVLKGNMP